MGSNDYALKPRSFPSQTGGKPVGTNVIRVPCKILYAIFLIAFVALLFYLAGGIVFSILYCVITHDLGEIKFLRTIGLWGGTYGYPFFCIVAGIMFMIAKKRNPYSSSKKGIGEKHA